MKLLLILILSLGLSANLCFDSAFSQNCPQCDKLKESGKEIPEILQTIGFTKYMLIDFYTKDSKDYFVFSEWRTGKRGDTVTYVVENGKVVDKFKGDGE